ncbi:hypothetical protein [Saliterribacillus persicus]|uniref:Sigma-70-like protein n=1 Tax=Saliterribacillus persicus TaxID=930114 RepID=A0A368X7K8_9BACI|nr:hypothetical protein [Saliterribacillus persicus]RCW62968.1 hypothetical protein DFR57_1215 [Saliterribacillus persicus]
MDAEINISKEDAIFYLEMIDSVKSPNFKPGLFRRKPYYILIKDRESINYKRFISVYTALRYVLSDREQFILNRVYGINHEVTPTKNIASSLQITPGRVLTIRNKANVKLAREILKLFKTKKEHIPIKE